MKDFTERPLALIASTPASATAVGGALGGAGRRRHNLSR
jgi:hypothetical protein